MKPGCKKKQEKVLRSKRRIQKYLKDIQNTTNQDLNSQQQNLQQKSVNSDTNSADTCDDREESEKFSAENNIDPVYRLRGGQYEYCGNVINFSQDVQEFVSRLP
ncbi:uncharacterized protein LOC113214430 [Rhizophagus clarus]|uniref:Uncharacterized protein LOC113214430 n=1 Tax=Rhizophagus clarus TaxID=94130 RepID=A0A8H3LTE3_9GLOM|nr:uncharacterized protein LOC113214430 [Rhizophagus clarus]